MTPTVFFDHLPCRFTTLDVRTLFGQHGIVTAAFVATKRHRSLGFGYVTYVSLQEAQQAVRALNGTEVEGHILTVYRSDSKMPSGVGAVADASSP